MALLAINAKSTKNGRIVFRLDACYCCRIRCPPRVAIERERQGEARPQGKFAVADRRLRAESVVKTGKTIRLPTLPNGQPWTTPDLHRSHGGRHAGRQAPLYS